ncbi:MAG: type II secretion system minor pseudopilin GspK [Deltaproteobacteria bacterium]|nr:type II secretion system minor pseudopilin GspK [Deltaproteobacteria bacterium]
MNLFQHPARNQRGVALILVISSIAMLTIMMVEFTFGSQLNLRISKNFQNALKAQALARSGIHFALLELKVYKSLKDNPMVKQIPGFQESMLDQIWQFGFIYPPIATKKATFGKERTLEEFTQKSKIDGKINVTIQDEGSKINLNDLENIQYRAAIIQQLDSIFEHKKTTDEEFLQAYKDLQFTDLINNIVDWIDKDTGRVGGGDEESYYSRLPVPYRSKNAPLDTVSELGLIEGFNDDTIFNLLLPYVTVYPTEGINVNTADATMLLTISPDLTPEEAQKIVEHRQKSGGFKTPQEFEDYCKNTLLKSADFNKNPKIRLTTSTNVFSLESKAEVGGATQTVRAVVNLSKLSNDGAPQIIYWNLN